MCCRLVFTLVLLATLTGLVPLAYASPPDPAWVSGFYDDADYDDVVVVVTTSIKAPEEATPLPVIASVTILLAFLCPTEAPGALSPALPAFQTRAPPIC
jgi:hypothetical protein